MDRTAWEAEGDAEEEEFDGAMGLATGGAAGFLPAAGRTAGVEGLGLLAVNAGGLTGGAVAELEAADRGEAAAEVELVVVDVEAGVTTSIVSTPCEAAALAMCEASETGGRPAAGWR